MSDKDHDQYKNWKEFELLNKAINLTAGIALTAVVLNYVMPVVSDLLWTRSN
jgi:hypothetical protein